MRAAPLLLALLLFPACSRYRYRRIYDFVESRDHDQALADAEAMIAKFAAESDEPLKVLGYGRTMEEGLPASFVDAFPMCHAWVYHDHVVVGSWKAMRTFTLYYFAEDADIEKILEEPLSYELTEEHREISDRVWCLYEDGSLD